MNISQRIGLSVLAAFSAISLPILLHAQVDAADEQYPISISNARMALLENGEIEIVGNIVLQDERFEQRTMALREAILLVNGFELNAERASASDGEVRMASVRISRSSRSE